MFGRTVAVALLALQSVVTAGPLTPPAGPVTPTHKTLSQIEPAIPIGPDTTPGDAGSVHRITQPGHYYLTGDVIGQSGKAGIVVVAPGTVVIDLRGFSMRGVAGALPAVQGTFVSGQHLVVRNGTFADWPSGAIRCILSGAISDVHARDCGADFDGATIRTGPQSRVERCTITGAPESGIIGQEASAVVDCTVVAASGGSSDTGISLPGGIVARCVVTGFASVGIAADGSVVAQCRVSGCGAGFYGTRAAFRDCLASSCQHGFFSSSPGGEIGGSTFFGCTAAVCAVEGFLTGAGDTLTDCTAEGGATGFILEGGTLARCVARRNTAHGFRTPILPAPTDEGPHFEACTALGNGGVGFFLVVAGASLVNCDARDNPGGGVRADGRGARLSGCIVEGNGPFGIGSDTPDGVSELSVERCTVRANTGVGVSAEASSSVTDSTIAANGADGILLTSSGLVRGCSITSNGGSGAAVGTACVLQGNLVSSNNTAALPGSAGILVTGNDTAVEGNRIYSNNQGGIRLDAAGNLVARNMLARTGATIVAVPGNSVAQIIASPAAGFVSTDPNANFTY